MSESQAFDLVVIGAGPGGYVCAIRAAQKGLTVAVVEKDPTLGGTCLNVGCIPSKALLHASHQYHAVHEGMGTLGIQVSGVKLDLPAMMAHKSNTVDKLTGGLEYLFKKNKITWLKGLGQLAGPGKVLVKAADGSTSTVDAKSIVIATGSTPSTIPGVVLDGKQVITSTEAIALTEVPKKLVVIGAGVIGLEIGSVWSRLGAQVTLVEYTGQILNGFDTELCRTSQRLFEKQGLSFVMNAKVQSTAVKGKKVTVTYLDKEGNEQKLEADKVLVSTGRKPNTDGLGAAEAGLKLDDRGRVEIDDRFQTNLPGVYAIGDVVRGPMLAHKAEDEGVALADQITTGHGHIDYGAIPSIVYTHPEVAFVGQTEDQLKAEGIPFKKGRFPFGPNGRALSMGETDGFVKILAHKETDRILGAHMVGPNAGDLVAEVALAMTFKASAEDVGMACHAHPTLSEVVKEAALAVDGKAIHA